MPGPYLEQVGGAFKIGCKPVVNGTNTEDVWRAKANTGRFVKVDTSQTASRDDGLLPVELLADDDTVAYGRLESVQGAGDMFTAVVLTLGANGYALGSSNNNAQLSDAEIGQTLKGAGDGKLKVASGGFGRVVGGNKTDLRVAWNSIERVR
jgi:hypothetical protein